MHWWNYMPYHSPPAGRAQRSSKFQPLISCARSNDCTHDTIQPYRSPTVGSLYTLYNERAHEVARLRIAQIVEAQSFEAQSTRRGAERGHEENEEKSETRRSETSRLEADQ